MAHRNFPSSRVFNFHQALVRIGGRITIGATGAVATQPSSTSGIASIARVSTGRYRITLQDGYNTLLAIKADMEAVNATTSSGIASVELLNSSVTMSQAAAGVMDILCFNAAGTITDPTSGSGMRIQIWLNNASV